MFLYMNKKLEKEIKQTTPFTIASKKNKIPRNHLTKEVKDLYTKTMTLIKEIEENANK